MSKFTTQVRFICESFAGVDESKGCDDIDTIIDSALDRIFNVPKLQAVCSYIDDAYLHDILHGILEHYYLSEIGFEVYGMWKYKLNNLLVERLPYYDTIYKTVLYNYNPLESYHMTRSSTTQGNNTDTKNRTSSGKTTYESLMKNSGEMTNQGQLSSTQTDSSTQSTSNNQTTLHSDTPQSGIHLDDVDTLNYLSDAQKTNTIGSNTQSGNSSGETTQQSTGKSTGSEERNMTTDQSNTGSETLNQLRESAFNEEIRGNLKYSYTELIKDYRKNVIIIKNEIIDECEKLFFGLWE